MHKVSRSLIDEHDLIVYEKLLIPNMTRSARGTLEQPGTNVAPKAGLNRSIHDAGWGCCHGCWATRRKGPVVWSSQWTPATPPRPAPPVGIRPRRTGAPRRCSDVEARGHDAHADVNAARNILRAGLAQRHQREADRLLATARTIKP